MVKFTKENLSKELLVAIEIYKQRNDKCHFNSIVNSLESQGLASRQTVSRAHDILTDQGMLDEEWIQRDDKRWIRNIRINKHSEEFVKKIQECIE